MKTLKNFENFEKLLKKFSKIFSIKKFFRKKFFENFSDQNFLIFEIWCVTHHSSNTELNSVLNKRIPTT